jgi:DNA-binding cell septation regulator SpoVG
MDSMLSLNKWVLTKYQTSVMKMNDDMNIVATRKTHMGYFYDIAHQICTWTRHIKLNPLVEEMFYKHLALLKAHFCFKKFITKID